MATPRYIPGTEIEYLQRHRTANFLIAQSDHSKALAAGLRLTNERTVPFSKQRQEPMEWVTAYGRATDDSGKITRYGPGALAELSADVPVTVEDERHVRSYRNPAIAAVVEEEIARINAQFARDVAARGKPERTPRVITNRVERPNILPSQRMTYAKWVGQLPPTTTARPSRKRTAKPQCERPGTPPASAPVTDFPRTGSPEWKRLVRQLLKERTGKAPQSVTAAMLDDLRRDGLIAPSSRARAS